MFRRNRTPLDRLRAERVALIKPSALGDIVHSLPVLHALRSRFPRAHIAWVVNKAYQPLIDGHPDLDETIPVDRGAMKGIRGVVGVFKNLLMELRRRRFDLAIDMQGLFRSGLMTAATGATRRVGLGTAREGSRYFCTDLIATPHGFDEHAVDRHWRVAAAFGMGDAPKVFALPIARDAGAWATQELRDCPRPWTFLGVGARWMTKRWPAASFAVLAQRVQKHFGGTAIFIGAPDETPLARAVIDQLTGPSRDYTGKTTLPQLTALLNLADVMISNDTGPLHIAAALGRPTVAPYTCTKVSRHGPYGNTRSAVESSVWCQGSYIKKCDRLECMPELHPDRLWYFLNGILDTWKRNCRSA
jgi:lipopolysaccharide heptosyltransferase I